MEVVLPVVDSGKDICSCTCSDGKSILVDLQTLCSYSGYFSALQKSEMQETLSKRITFRLISSDVLTLLTNLIHQYSMTKSWIPLLDNMTVSVIEELLFAADYLDIESVRNMCDSWLASKCSLTEALCFGQLVLLCNRYNLELLRKEIYSYSKGHIMVIKESLSVLDVLSFDIVKEVLQSDETEVDSEWDLVDFICLLFTHNEIIKPEEQIKLLKLIRVPRLLVNPNHETLLEELENEVVREFLKSAFSSCKSEPKLYLKTFPWQFGIRQPRKAVICFRIPFAKSLTSALMVSPLYDKVTEVNDKDDIAELKYSMHKDHLSTENIMQEPTQMPTPDWNKKMELKFHNVPENLKGIATKSLREFAVAKLGRSVYVAGGQWRYSLAGQFAIESMMRLDLDALEWYRDTSMLSKRCLFSLVHLEGMLFAVGGVNSEGELSSSEMFNPHTQTWTLVTSLSYRVHEHSACVYQDEMYVSGGHNGHHHLNTVSCYNVVTQQWRQCAPLLFARSYHSMIECGGKLFVIGGCKFRRRQLMTVQICEVYNIEANQWTQLVSKFPTHFTACLSTWQTGTDIVLVGGYSFRQQKYRTKQYILHTEDHTWTVERVNFPNRTFGWKEAVFQEVLLGESTYSQTFINRQLPD